MRPDTLKTYNAAQDLMHRGTPFGRAQLFKSLGGTFTAPERGPGYPDELVWQADLFGILRTANSCDEAITKWAKAALSSVRRRATDGRPDCPYNGNRPAPEFSPTPAA